MLYRIDEYIFDKYNGYIIWRNIQNYAIYNVEGRYKKSMVSIKKRSIAFVLCLLLVISCSACKKQEAKSSGYSGTVDGVQFELADAGADVNIHSELQNSYLADVAENGDPDCMLLYAQGIMEESRPVPVEFSWTATSDSIIENYTVCISTTGDMSTVFYSESTTESNLSVYNLEIGTTYYWTVTANVAGKEITSGIASFTISSAGPRNLYIDGITNARDIGGWQTADDGRVKQGMIYRSGRMNESNDPTPTIMITETGKHWFKDILGVKSDIDLRTFEEAGQITESPLGNDVTYLNAPMVWENNILTDNTEMIKEVFAFLAKEENYPVVIHCSIGTDRTGMMCFLINSLCGVSETDLCADYSFSNFGSIGSGRSTDTIMVDYIPIVSEAEGENLQLFGRGWRIQRAFGCGDHTAYGGIRSYI